MGRVSKLTVMSILKPKLFLPGVAPRSPYAPEKFESGGESTTHGSDSEYESLDSDSPYSTDREAISVEAFQSLDLGCRMSQRQTSKTMSSSTEKIGKKLGKD